MERVSLPPVSIDGGPGLGRVLNARRSHRSFTPGRVSPADLGQILWAGLGRSVGHESRRISPSAGACYPISLYAAVGVDCVDGLDAATYRYDADQHSLAFLRNGDVRQAMARAALCQLFIAEAPVVLILVAEPGRTTSVYGGDRGMRYVYMDAGHVAENIYLQATALGLGTVAVGAFRDAEVVSGLNLAGSFKAVYLMPVGRVPQ